MRRELRDYAVVTAAYWVFTLSDGALRMLVLLHFNTLGYTPVQLALLFVLYELCGVLTNLFGGLLAARLGLKATLTAGMALQTVALAALAAVRSEWVLALSVGYVMGAQALSGVAKDLTKMSAKSSVKALVPAGAQGALFRWVAVLTGSKNALKGVGFFLGGALLGAIGFRASLLWMAAAVALGGVAAQCLLPADLGRAKKKPKFSALFSASRGVNVLSAARFFLFGARDVWFVVGVPLYFYDRAHWSFEEVGSFMAAWVIAYGVVQSASPRLVRGWTGGSGPTGASAALLALLLAAGTLGLAFVTRGGTADTAVLVAGLGVFGVLFALNSAVHSYLILAYAEGDRVAVDVGFYYMANAGGRLLGTLLSGALYAWTGLFGSLVCSAGLAAAAGVIAVSLPPVPSVTVDLEAVSGEG